MSIPISFESIYHKVYVCQFWLICYKPEIRKNIDGPKILQSEIRAAVSRMKGNKPRGPDGIVIEMIKALDDFGIEKLTIMANEIYDTGKIPQDLSK